MMNSPVQQIKERLGIEEVVSSYIKLEKAGANWKASCPFHNEKTPSFFISPDRGSYYCFGCGASGDIFTFVQEFEGLDFKGALKLLADKAGIPLGLYDKTQEDEKETLYKAMEEATNFFNQNLFANTGALDYLKKRGLTESTIKLFRLGYAKNDWRTLYEHLKSKNFNDSEIEKAGLAKKIQKENGRESCYDRFRGRIMFPIFDSSGRVIAFSGRIYDDDGKSAKYLNSPDTPIFNKSYVLYGLDRAKDSIRKNNFSILVEGQMDLILSHQAGFHNTVASSGTALSDSTVSKENAISNLGLVRRLSGNIILAFDADKAGFNASLRAGKIALSLGMDVKVAALPEGYDPADLIQKKGKEAWKQSIKDSKHIIDFLLDKIKAEADLDERKLGRMAKEKILPFLYSIDSAIEQSHFIKKISSSIGVSEESLIADMKKAESDTSVSEKYDKGSVEETSFFKRRDQIERKLKGVLIWQKSLAEPTIDLEKFLSKFKEDVGYQLLDSVNSDVFNVEELIFEAEVSYAETARLEEEIFELIVNLKEEVLREELSKKMKELHSAELNKDTDKSNEILAECQIINNQLEEIKISRFK